MNDLIHKHFDKFLLVCVLMILIACLVFDPNRDHAEVYKPTVNIIIGAIMALVTKSATSTPTTTTTTEGPIGATETRTEIKS